MTLPCLRKGKMRCVTEGFKPPTRSSPCAPERDTLFGCGLHDCGGTVGVAQAFGAPLHQCVHTCIHSRPCLHGLETQRRLFLGGDDVDSHSALRNRTRAAFLRRRAGWDYICEIWEFFVR